MSEYHGCFSCNPRCFRRYVHAFGNVVGGSFDPYSSDRSRAIADLCWPLGWQSRERHLGWLLRYVRTHLLWLQSLAALRGQPGPGLFRTCPHDTLLNLFAQKSLCARDQLSLRRRVRLLSASIGLDSKRPAPI